MDNRTALTYRYEKWRALSSGILEAAGATFLLVIAERWFHAGATAKALVAGGGSLGLLLAPLLVAWVEGRGWTTSMAAARLSFVGAGCFLLSAALPFLPVFVLCSLFGMATISAAIPLLTQIYQDNYPATDRGRRFSRTMIIRIATAAVFSDVAGRALDGHIGYFRWLLIVFAAALAFGGFCLRQCPSRPLSYSGKQHPLRALRFAKSDLLFRRTLISWMLMGTGTLMMQPLRVEYLANPKYAESLNGQLLTVSMIALLTGVIPNLVRLVLSPLWGWLFDHLNFFVLRISVNIGFMLGILTFFTSNSFSGLLWGAVLYGVSNAGGDVAWSLWVTKFAPPERVADYMATHTFFTGVRGVIAPILSFHLVAINVSLGTLGWICTGLIVLATTLLIPEIRSAPRTQAAAALVKDVSE